MTTAPGHERRRAALERAAPSSPRGPAPGTRAARASPAVLPDGRAYYDGRATAAENFSERTGIAEPGPGGSLVAVGDGPVAGVRYVDALALPGGGLRLFYEAPLPDGSHELRTAMR